MTEEAPENTGPSLDDFSAAMRKATLEGMKDYDLEREQWEEAVRAQEEERKKSENDNPPAQSGGLGSWLLGGKPKSG